MRAGSLWLPAGRADSGMTLSFLIHGAADPLLSSHRKRNWPAAIGAARWSSFGPTSGLVSPGSGPVNECLEFAPELDIDLAWADFRHYSDTKAGMVDPVSEREAILHRVLA